VRRRDPSAKASFRAATEDAEPRAHLLRVFANTRRHAKRPR